MSNWSWTQPQCDACFERAHGAARLATIARLAAAMREPELCVTCAEITSSGIYIRIDPAAAPHPSLTK